MERPGRIIGAIVGVVVVIVALFFAYVWISGGDGTASGTLTAPTLDVAANATATDAPESAATEEDEATAVPAVSETERPSADETESAVASETETVSAPSASEGVLFEISQADSEVRFELDEMLRGQPTHVVGLTDQVAGQIFVNFENPSASQVGGIRINARTLQTDSENRNRALRSFILQSSEDAYEYIDFTPTEISGLPDSVTMGEAFTFQLTGDLKIRDIIQPVTFDVTLTPVSETRLEGTASTVVTRAQYNLTIPNAPGVADVTDEVTLSIDFVALAA